ncbi:MAG TPA: amino acid permease [Gemmatimonadales bacterium]|nr:amino acid permease [Gemmatimonadales bacterium]
MTTTQQPQTEFVRAISRLDATALVVGSMIGSGIFIVSAEILREVHAPGLLLVVWGLSGVVTLMGALSYGELAAMFPNAGGQYVYLREGISPLFGYLYGWTLFVVIQTGTIAAVAVAFARFTSVFWPGLSPDVFLGSTVHFPQPIGDVTVGLSPQRLFAVASLVVLTWINVRGVRTAAIIQTSLTAIKTAALAALILLGLTIGRHADALAANFGASFWATDGAAVGLAAVGAAMVGSLFSMDAWNNVGFAGSELKEPRKDLPFAMGVGVLIVTLLYVLANVAYLNVLPATAIANAPQDRVGTAALQAILGQPGLKLMAAAIMISTFGCNNGLILSGARVYYAMARDDLFFKSAGLLHPRYKTPTVALIVQAVWTCLLCLSGTYTQLLNFVIFAALVFYMLTAVGLFALRVKRPTADRPVRAPGYPWLPGLYVLMTGVIAADLLTQDATRTYSALGLGLVLLGVPVYFGWRALVKRAA